MLAVPETIRDAFLGFFPEKLRPEIKEAIPELEFRAMRLGMEILDVERSGVAFADAVDRTVDWPLMGRVHHGMIDFLQHEIPLKVRDILRVVFRRVQQWEGLGDLRKVVACRASLDEERPDCALARFFLYQAMRLNLWIICWDKPEVEALGCLKKLDRDAEELLRKHLHSGAFISEGIRPLNVLVADAFLRLSARFNEAHAALKQEAPEIIEFFCEFLEKIVSESREMNAADGALLRNMYEGILGGHKLESLQLSERNPHLFPSRAAVDMRFFRLKRKLEPSSQLEPNCRRVRGRFIDMLRSEIVEKAQ